ncbi:MAG TPA: PASTA domain-containing protein, partial [Firmicutes bacterium]|nr:PASTA domain-containing protein [Bacillota bacterium]
EYIQFIVERELDRAMIEYQPLRAMVLVVNPMTGEVLAMSGKPDFDPNDYASYPKEYWNISPISNTFEPGSTFKLVTLSSAIEENKYNMNEGFYCGGSVRVAGHNIHCWTGNGHGAISYLEVVYGSCNPGFINLGQRLGKDTLQKYIDAFGFGVRTGIDLPGESTGIIFNPEDMGPVELATTSFGQGVSVTPIQQVMAIAAMINGGTLYEPYLVKEITDADGNTIEKKSPTPVRQVISKETSDQVRHIMEQVVIHGTARNAAIPGYRIGGKTGTAQKVGPGGHYIAGEYIVSFVGFLPLENPQILLYVAVDGAKRGAQWGSQISAPIGKRIFKDIITYLSLPPDAEEENDSFKELVTVPNLEGLNLRQAGSAVDSTGLVIRAVGEGNVIEKQTPKAGARVPLQTEILVYLGKNGGEEVEIPNFSGWTMRQAAEVLNWLGLTMESRGSGVVNGQDPAPGEKVKPGDTVILEFSAID